MGTREQPRPARRRRRRRKPWGFLPLTLLLAVMIAGGILIFNSCNAKDGENQQDPAGNNNENGTSQNDPDSSGQDGEKEPNNGEEPDPYEGYTIKTMTQEDMEIGEQILVSNEHTYAFPTAAEQQLVNLVENKSNTYTSNVNDTLILPVTVEHLNQLIDAYVAQGGGKDIMVVSGYRTYDFQQGLFDRSAARNGLEHAQRYVAQAGGSEHHTGYAVDLWSQTTQDYFEGVGEYQWITDNCHKYGFILRYTTEKEPYTKIGPESWHFRYVGVPHSYLIVEHGFCLEEYIDFLRNYPFDGEHLTCQVEGTNYEIYYVKGLEVPVPESGTYTVSGNNVDGFIVTVTK